MPSYPERQVHQSQQNQQHGRNQAPQKPGRQQLSVPTDVTGQTRGQSASQGASQGMISRKRLRPDMSGKTLKQRQNAGRQQGRRDIRTVRGFGNNIPLALALRRIVPANYAYTFGEGVDHNTPISWEGGQSWRTTLRRALQAKGLDMKIQNGAVRITKARTRMTRSSAHQATSSRQAVSKHRGRLTRPRSQQLQGQSRHASGDGMQHYNTGDQSQSRTSRKSMAPVAVPTRLPGTRNASPQTPASGRAGTNHHGAARSAGAYENAATQSRALSRTYSFDADEGDSLRTTLQSWSQKAGVELRWEPAYDFTLRDDINMKGDFSKGVSQVLAQYRNAAPKPHGRLHTTSDSGTPVLIIE